MIFQPIEFRIPVFVQNDTIVVERKGGILKHSRDLSKARDIDTTRFLSIRTLHDAVEGKNAVKSIWGFNTRDIDALHAGLKQEFPIDHFTTILAEKMRRDFYQRYDQLPAPIRILCETAGIQVVIAAPNENIHAISGKVGKNTDSAMQHGKFLYYTTDSSLRFPTVLEEVYHAIDDGIGRHANAKRFSVSKAWQKATALDLSDPSPLTERLYEDVETIKGNAAIKLALTDQERSVESLPDLIRIEHFLIQYMIKYGNLSALSPEISPQDGIGSVMMKSMPNMWQLYRGASANKKLIQHKSGRVQQTHLNGRIPTEFKSVVSFTEACQWALKEQVVGCLIDYTVQALPEPRPPMPALQKSATPHAALQLH